MDKGDFRKTAEEALAEEAAWRRILMEQSRDGIVVLDDQGGVYEANRMFAEMLGYSPEEVRRLHVWDWDHQFTRDQLAGMLQGIDETGDHFETLHRRKDGTLLDVEISTNAAVCGGRKLIFCVCRDISERRRAEASLRESEARLRAIFDSAQEAIYLKDADLRYTHCNRAMMRMFGLSRDEIVGRTDADLWTKEAAGWIQEVDRKVLSGRPYMGAHTRMLNGVPATFHTSKSPVCDASGRVVGLCGVSRDITEEVRMREQMRQSQKVEAVGRLAGGVAHDLNNMLSPILGYAEILMQDLGANDARREAVNEILRAGFRARDLVRQLLAFSRKQTLEFKPVDINRTIRGFEKLLRRSVREDTVMEIVLSPDLPTVSADAGQIEQILLNLVVNAADAMPNGGRLTIETAMERTDDSRPAARPYMKPGRYVLLTVRDTGCGMDKETLDRIFEPFFSTKGEHGTGLGLATVYGIVKQHDGYIWAESEPNGGATFRICLPVAGGEAPAEAPPAENPPGTEGMETILLVEDNEQVRRLAQAILGRQGYVILAAENSEEALRALASHAGRVDLLLTDVVMPGMNGKELYGKAVEIRPDLKVLFMSGYTNDVIARRGVLEEGVRFVQKPFTVQSLAAKVREVLAQD
ncbi:MAG: PAS domain S-box protein [Thermodesulfobacteriota bacterium]